MNAKRRGNRLTGAVLIIISVTGFFVYTYFLFGTQYSMLLIQLTVLAAIAILLSVFGWIGYTMLTAPPMKDSDNRTS
jgi:uncharacterized membrane protein